MSFARMVGSCSSRTTAQAVKIVTAVRWWCIRRRPRRTSCNHGPRWLRSPREGPRRWLAGDSSKLHPFWRLVFVTTSGGGGVFRPECCAYLSQRRGTSSAAHQGYPMQLLWLVCDNDNANDAAGNHLRRLPLVLKLLHLSYENAKMKPCAMCDVRCALILYVVCMYVCMYNAVLSVHV
jgi:hypothetical protein